METRITPMAVETAREDLQNRTLAKLKGNFARLIYLASTRDYTTGRYQHDGLANEFSPDAAAAALTACHQEIFQSLATSSLEDLVEDLEVYARCNQIEMSELIGTWEKLQPYRITPPMNCGPLTAELFTSNVTVALAILRSRLLPRERHPQDA
ncbi:MAG: hypothetical protein LAN84_07570 [Acidobacteriia bacterium]|nr:hypothetical protein [Terriglobia bacterium]